MITAQDIREKTFEKATFGGYDMSEVDDFLEDMAADVAAAQKESGVLKSKMKVLVDKIEEYRANEEAMHLALLSAQKVAKEVEGEAKARAEAVLGEAQAKADAILSDAQAKADAVTGNLRTQREVEEKRLAAAKDASAEYIQHMLLVCQKQSDFLTALKGMEGAAAVVTPAPAEKKAMPQPAVEEPQAEPELPAQEPEADFPAAEPVEDVIGYEAEEPEAPYAGEPDAEESKVDEPTRMFRF